MSLASYPAGSRTVDPQAPGGHGVSNNFPTPISRPELRGKGLTALLVGSKDGVTLYLGNDRGESWLRASDGNLTGWLEAKNPAGQWKPIEFHHWAWCGNSRHRVNLPRGHEWRYTIPVARGSLRTFIRWRIPVEGGELVSNEVRYEMTPARFALPPHLAREYVLEADWIPPAIKPKGIGG